MGKKVFLFFLGVFSVIICLPVVMVLIGSFKSGNELITSLAPILSETKGSVRWTVLPQYPTFKHYIKLLFQTPQFFVLFWNSVRIVGSILLGQLLIATPAAWAFAEFKFPFKRLIFTIYIVLMLIPFQITMLPSYLTLNRLQLLNTQEAVILPAIFSTFPVFLIYRGFSSIPKCLIEAARVDGASDFTIFIKIGIPLGYPGILSAMVLGFLEYWNMIEQPLAFLKDKSLWPLSLYLPEINLSQSGMSLAASVITLIPAFFVFILGQNYLEQGIIASGIKE